MYNYNDIRNDFLKDCVPKPYEESPYSNPLCNLPFIVDYKFFNYNYILYVYNFQSYKNMFTRSGKIYYEPL